MIRKRYYVYRVYEHGSIERLYKHKYLDHALVHAASIVLGSRIETDNNLGTISDALVLGPDIAVSMREEREKQNVV